MESWGNENWAIRNLGTRNSETYQYHVNKNSAKFRENAKSENLVIIQIGII